MVIIGENIIGIVGVVLFFKVMNVDVVFIDVFENCKGDVLCIWVRFFSGFQKEVLVCFVKIGEIW